MFNLIKKLTKIPGVSGEESEIRDLIVGLSKQYEDKVFIDKIGNVIVKKNGVNKDDGRKIAFVTNMDTNGVMITDILENGLLKFIPVGSQSKSDLYGCSVIFEDNIRGLIVAEKNLKSGGFSGEIYIDIDSRSRKESEDSVSIGDTGVIFSDFEFLKDRIRSGVLHNRAVCGVFISLIKELENIQCSTYFIFSVQGMDGIRSINSTISDIKPDIVILVDSAAVNIIKSNEYALGRGPILNVIDSEIYAYPKLVSSIRKTAQDNGISIQNRFNSSGKSRMMIEDREINIVMNARISIPCQNFGSAFETMSMQDLQQTKKLLECFLKTC